MAQRLAADRLRTVELVGALSLAADLTMGQPMEHGLASGLLAVRLGRAAGADEAACAAAFFTGLLRWVGCTANATEYAALLGDDIAGRAELVALDPADPAALAALDARLAAAGGGFRLPGPAGTAALAAAHCDVAQGLAVQLGLGADTVDGLGHLFERWDGAGFPRGLAGDALPAATRIATLAGDLTILARLVGPAAAVRTIAERAGTAYDPELAGPLRREGERWLAELGAAGVWERVLEEEPGPRASLSGAALDRGLEAAADFTDMKSAWTLGHSRGVAALAAAAAAAAGREAAEVVAVRRAGLLHDLGRVGVSNAVWDKADRLTDAEWEQVRLHPYLTERALARSPFLSGLGALASLHHERGDGTGYHRGLPAAAVPPAGRLLAAADAYRARTEPRPHRPGLTSAAAARAVRAEVAAGRLDAAAVDAVLAAAGHPVRRRATHPAGLTAREVEVLRLLARGRTNREIAARLVVSPKTVGHHVEHLYAKLGTSTRAGATLFALRHDLVGEPGDEGGR